MCSAYLDTMVSSYVRNKDDLAPAACENLLSTARDSLGVPPAFALLQFEFDVVHGITWCFLAIRVCRVYELLPEDLIVFLR